MIGTYLGIDSLELGYLIPIDISHLPQLASSHLLHHPAFPHTLTSRLKGPCTYI